MQLAVAARTDWIYLVSAIWEHRATSGSYTPCCCVDLDTDLSCSLYVHVFASYVYFGFVLFVIYRELLFYVAIRQAYMHSDLYSSRLSSRTVMITAIPERYRSEEALRTVFGPSVEHVWMNRQNPKLERLVQKRDRIAMKLEEAETELIKRTDKQRRRALRRHADVPAVNGESVDGNGNAVQRWFNNTYIRPSHRIMWGKKVDTISWCREQLEILNREVQQSQKQTKTREAGTMCALISCGNSNQLF
jgi:hypothetical protein